MTKIPLKFILLLCVPLILSSCGNNGNERRPTETIDSGRVEVFCDTSYIFAMDSIFKMYQERYKKVELKINYVNARNAVAHLFSGQTRVAIVGRDYLKDEDSIIKSFNVKPYYQMDIANDGLVFFAKSDFQLDTLNTDILLKYWTTKSDLSDLLGNSDIKKFEFAIANQNSSEYGNFINQVCQQKPITKNITLLENTDSVIKYVNENPDCIGICYLSQVQGKFFKILRVGYNDKNGRYIKATKPPHQSYIVMGEYPYTTLLRLYLLEDRKNLPFWFGAFCEKENTSVNYYKKKRLVPSYATYRLEDERR